MSAAPSAIRIALVEDQPEERENLARTLRAASGLACVAECESGIAALEELPDLQPDVVLMDIQMPGLSGIECTRRLQPLLPETQFMMLTVVEDHDLIFRSLEAGATGYLLKKTQPQKVVEAIRELHAGGAPMSGQIARKVVAAFRKPAASKSADDRLSPTEQAVLERLARGLLYKEVAEDLNLSPSTVRTHVWHIYRKLQVHNRTEAVLKGLGRRK